MPGLISLFFLFSSHRFRTSIDYCGFQPCLKTPVEQETILLQNCPLHAPDHFVPLELTPNPYIDF